MDEVGVNRRLGVIAAVLLLAASVVLAVLVGIESEPGLPTLACVAAVGSVTRSVGRSR